MAVTSSQRVQTMAAAKSAGDHLPSGRGGKLPVMMPHRQLHLSEATSHLLRRLPEPPAPPQRTRVILPKKKPLKWSTGVAPGDYGGPPTTSKLRRYWGGEDPDPLASGDFMRNKDFMARIRRLVDDPVASSSSPAIQSPSSEVEDSGFF